VKGALTPVMRRCLYNLQREGGVLERRSEGKWTSATQPNPPAWTVPSNSVEALIARGQLVVTKTQPTGYSRPYPTQCALAAGARG